MLSSVLKYLVSNNKSATERHSAVPIAAAQESGDSADGNTVFTIEWGLHGLLGVLTEYQFESVLDIGSGSGEHARLFRHFTKKVSSVDLNRDADFVGDFSTSPSTVASTSCSVLTCWNTRGT